MKKSKYILILTLLTGVIFYFYAPNITAYLTALTEGSSAKSQLAQSLTVDLTDFTKSDLLEENKKLKETLANLSYVRIYNKSLEFEIAELKNLLSDEKHAAQKQILARVVNTNQKPAPVFIKILPEGDPKEMRNPYVFTSFGFILGDLFVNNSAYDRYAIKPFSIPGREIKGILRFDSNSPSDKLAVDVVSAGSGIFEFFVNKEYKVKEGDILYFKTYPMAVVRKVFKTSESPFIKVWAGLPFNLSVLDYVLIKDI